ncbi:MAG: tRNA uracil 4-sulfurtransferase ThiI [Planctomycetota bacterium]
MTACTGGAELLIARYGEMWLKGKNRRLFEEALVQNVRAAVAPIAKVVVRREHGQLLLRPERRYEEVARRAAEVFGIASLSPARSVKPRLDDIVEASRVALAELVETLPADRRVPFKIEVRRSYKQFPMTSAELENHVAERTIGPHEHRLRVDLKGAEVKVGINVRPEQVYVFAERRPGAGGLPVGTIGHAVCLLSGGIDSPVAAWMTMKRGCTVAYLSFHSSPYLGAGSKRKIAELVRSLARFQPTSRLLIAPFAEIQTAIRDHAPEGYRTILYRRMMQRIGSRVAATERAGVLVTGESLGQVASQTMENLTCIEAASSVPVLRPLIAFDKAETIVLARRIGTYDISVLPEPDCCTVFQPAHPTIRGRVQECERAEEELDVAGLVDRAVEGIELREL